MSRHESQHPPFTAQHALSTERLTTEFAGDIGATGVPNQKSNVDALIDYIPGAPNISLSPSAVNDFLTDELSTPLLDELYNHLWFVARKSGNHIDPLHRQTIKGRKIVPAEDPRLHLVWQQDKVYVKPIPQCLLNYDFWTTYLQSNGSTCTITTVSDDKLNTASPLFDRSVALGFLRSYAFLIRHRSDFRIACEAHLIPLECDWTKWAKFTAQVYSIPDRDVAKRYHYGQIRLRRLNWCVRFLRPKAAQTVWWYEIPHWTIRTGIERALTPMVFAFASISVVLSSMQVMLAVPSDGLGWKLDGVSLITEYRAFWLFSTVMLLFSCLAWFLVAFIPTAVFFWQFQWGYRHRNGLRKEKLMA